jgi:hypothetical protein
MAVYAGDGRFSRLNNRMSIVRKFLINAASTVFIGLISIAVYVYIQPYDSFFPPATVLLWSSALFGLVLMPIHVAINLVLHVTKIVRMNEISVSFIVWQAVVLVASLGIGFYAADNLPMETTHIVVNGSYAFVWYFEPFMITTYGYILLLIFTIIGGKRF